MTEKYITLLPLNRSIPALFYSNQNDCFTNEKQINRKKIVAQQAHWTTLTSQFETDLSVARYIVSGIFNDISRPIVSPI